MKKLLLFFAVFAFALSSVNAQESYFQKGDNALNLGIGVGSHYYSGVGYSMSVPPVSALYEIGIADGIIDKGVIGVGPYIGYFAYKWDYTVVDNWGYKYTNLVIGTRGNFHYPLIDKLDTYAGVFLGYNVVTAKEFGTYAGSFNYNTSSGGLVYSGVLGARYYFTESLAGMAEVGYGIAYLTLGLTLKL